MLLSIYVLHTDFSFSQEDDPFSTSISLKANAGEDMFVIEGQSVTLDAANSFTKDPPIESFSWKQIFPESPKLSLSNNNTANPSFVVPGLPIEMIFTFELEITDGDENDTDTINIYVTKPDDIRSDPSPNQFVEPEKCFDNIDNDRDGKIDMQDEECGGGGSIPFSPGSLRESFRSQDPYGIQNPGQSGLPSQR